MTSIPIDVVRAFVAVVETRGFTRAAEALGRSQPTVSLQVKRLEELIEAPLFKKAARFEMTAVGSVCFEYGRRLVRLHDEMLEEAARRKAPGGRLRIGLPGEIAERLAARLVGLGPEVGGAELEVVTGDADSLAVAYRDNRLDVALLLAAEADEAAAGRWLAPLGWVAGAGRAIPKPPEPVRLVLPPREAAIHAAAHAALGAVGRPFAIVCASPDAAVRAAAVASGLGLAPMIDGLLPAGLERASDPDLPPLAPLIVSLLARTDALAAAGRRWVAGALALEPA